MEGGSVVIEVARDDVQRVTLRHGLQAPHPLLQILMGCALVAAGYFPAAHLIHWFRHGGTFFTFEAFVIPFAFLGLSMVVTALRSGYYLDVEERQGRKRLLFRPEPNAGDLQRFADDAERCLGLRITREA